MRKKILNLLLTGILAIASLTIGCGNTNDSADTSVKTDTDSTSFLAEGLNEAKTIRVGYQVSIFNVYNIEAEKHWVEEEFAADGITVEWIEFSYGVAMVEALNAGELDIATSLGDTPLINAYANDADVIAVYVTPKDPYALALVVAPDYVDTIKSVADLEGKRVAYSIGTASQDFLAQQLDSVGLTEEDIVTLNVSSGSGDLQTALSTGEADVAVIYEPNGTIAADTIGGALLSCEEVKQAVGISVANKSFAESNPELLARFIKQEKLYESYISENTDDYVSIVVDTTGLPEYAVKQVVERYEFQDGFQEEQVEDLANTVSFLYKSGFLENEIDISGAYTNIYYDEAKRLLESE